MYCAAATAQRGAECTALASLHLELGGMSELIGDLNIHVILKVKNDELATHEKYNIHNFYSQLFSHSVQIL